MADIGPIGGAIYVNQQMASVASEKTALLNRFELQALAAATASQETRREIEEVRPPEENQAVDPDREHTKEQAEQEERRPNHKEEEVAHPEAKTPLHFLDIKV
jgi:outer membrane biosynthesis protein TonB